MKVFGQEIVRRGELTAAAEGRDASPALSACFRATFARGLDFLGSWGQTHRAGVLPGRLRIAAALLGAVSGLCGCHAPLDATADKSEPDRAGTWPATRAAAANEDPFDAWDGPPPLVVRHPYQYTIRPLSDDEAQWYWPRLPKGVSHVEYAHYSEWMAWQVWFRFEAPAEVCKQAAGEMLEEWNRRNPSNKAPTDLREIDRAAQQQYIEQKAGRQPKPPVYEQSYREDTSKMPIEWFVPERIARGLEGGGGQGNRVKVWVDLDRGVVFYQEGSGAPDPE